VSDDICITRPDGSRFWIKPGGGLRTTLAELKKTESFWRDLVTLKRIRNLQEKK